MPVALLRKAELAPCPACDTPLDPALANATGPVVCPACGQVLAPVRVARAWRRFASGAIDLLILSITAGPLHWLLTRLVPGSGLAPGARGWDAALTIGTMPLGSLLMRAAPFLLMCALYLFLFSALTGKTPGQTVLGVRVVDGHGGRPALWRAGLRVMGLGLGLLPIALGPLWALFDMERRALHDHLAGTWLVRDLDPVTSST